MEAKYLDLLDEEVLGFIEQTEKLCPSNTVDASISEQRKQYDALCKAFHIAYPEGVSSSDRTLITREYSLPLREYNLAGSIPKAHVLFFHGGGFVVGGLDTHDSICAEFCGRTGCKLTAVDYRLAPEHLHPAAFDDALIAFQRISNESNLPVILVGDSAGGNLAAAVSHTVRQGPSQPIGQVLIYPALGGDQTKGSYLEHAHAPALTLADIDYYHRIRSGGDGLPQEVNAMPLLDTNFKSLPPTVIITAQCDPLADDGKDYCNKLVEAGGTARWFNEKGLIHGYLRARSTVKVAADSVTRMVEAISMLANRKWDYT